MKKKVKPPAPQRKRERRQPLDQKRPKQHLSRFIYDELEEDQ